MSSRRGIAWPTRSINFVTAHDGFSLADLVSYAEKHNEANGENNRDGTDANYSWTSGADARALLATLLLSRGTPMLAMGDECGRSQRGNNNAYAQDNKISWLDWANADEALIDFTARLVRARRDCPALTGGRVLTGRAIDATGIADVAWLLPDGRPLTPEDWQRPGNHTLIAALYASDCRAVVVLHAGSGRHRGGAARPAPGASVALWRSAISGAAFRRAVHRGAG